MSYAEERGLPTRAELARREHGTRLRYIGGCRCVECRKANAAYERRRSLARAQGKANPIVDAKEARLHIRKLSKKGVGYRAVAQAAGVARGVVADIKSGRKPRCRAMTVRAILAVTESAAAPRALVDAEPTRRRIRELLAEGFTKRQLARRFGMKSPALQFPLEGTERITAKNAAKVERLWRFLLMDLED